MLKNIIENINKMRNKTKLLLGYTYIFILTIALLTLLIGSQFFLLQNSLKRSIEDELNASTNLILNMVKLSSSITIGNYIRAVLEKNKEVIDHYYHSYQEGKISEKTAKNQIEKILLAQTIGKSGYLYVLDINQAPKKITLRIHPKIPIGTDVSSFGFVQKQATMKNGDIDYIWKNPRENISKKKSVYFYYFKPWQWIVSASVYKNELIDLIEINKFREKLLDIPFGKFGYPFILDSKGNLLFHPKMQGNVYNVQDSENGHFFIKEMCEKKNGKTTYYWKNPGEEVARKKLVFYNYIPELDWIVASSIYPDEIYAPLDKLRNISIIIFTFLLLLLFLLSFGYSSYIIENVKNLIIFFQNASGGNFKDIIPIKNKNDEFGRLYQYVNDFMKTLDIYSQSLKKAEEKYRSIFENASNGVFQISITGKFLAANQAMANILGYESGDDLINTIIDIRKQFPVNPPDVDYFLNIIRKDGFIKNFECPIYCKNKTIIDVSINAHLVFDDQKNVQYFEGSVINISERKRSEMELKRYQENLEDLVNERTLEISKTNHQLNLKIIEGQQIEKELRESEQKFRLLFERSSDAILLLDGKVFIDCNQAAMDMMDCHQKEELLGIHPSLLSPERQADGRLSSEKADEFISNAFKNGRCRFEWIYRKMSGKDFYVEVSLTLVPLGGKQILYTIWRDITNKKKAETELQNITVLQQTILNGVNYMIISTTPDGTIVTFNAAAEQLLAYKKEEVIGKATLDLFFDPIEVNSKKNFLSRELRNNFNSFEVITIKAQKGIIDEREWTFITKNGQSFPVLLSINALYDHLENITGFVGIGTDITEQKLVTEKMQNAVESADWANRAKSIFVSNIGHEIRTPLNSIIGMADILTETHLNEDQTKYVASINRAGETLLGIINNVLDLSKIEAGGLYLESIKFDLSELLMTVVDILNFKAKEKHLYLKLVIDPTINTTRIRVGDPTRIKQVLINLVQNAIKFTTIGGVLIKAEAEEIANTNSRDNLSNAKNTSPFVIISIIDTGIGIPENMQKMLFQRFQQLDNSITRKYGGTGLGLNISKELIKLIKGDITFESIPDQGTTFKVRIPLPIMLREIHSDKKHSSEIFLNEYNSIQSVVQTVTEITNENSYNFEDIKYANFNILIAEDSEDNQVLFITYLKKTHLKFEIVENGLIAVQKFQNNINKIENKSSYDLILMDISMPELDGYSATSAIRAIEKENNLKQTPILALTAFAMLDEKNRCIEAGCNGHIAKPIKRIDFLKAIFETLNIVDDF